MTPLTQLDQVIHQGRSRRLDLGLVTVGGGQRSTALLRTVLGLAAAVLEAVLGLALAAVAVFGLAALSAAFLGAALGFGASELDDLRKEVEALRSGQGE